LNLSQIKTAYNAVILNLLVAITKIEFSCQCLINLNSTEFKYKP